MEDKEEKAPVTPSAVLARTERRTLGLLALTAAIDDQLTASGENPNA